MKQEKTVNLTISDKILIGASKCIENNPEKGFTFEELVLHTWKVDKNRFGLRGCEEKYPDSHKLHAHVFGGTALVAKGYLRFEKNGSLYLTDAGLARSMSFSSSKTDSPRRISKRLQHSIINLLENKIFRQWLDDPSNPKEFRGAAFFWGISPGTPPKFVRSKLSIIENTLKEILKFLNETGANEIREERVKGKILFERKDVERCLDFHNDLKNRFKKELKILDPKGNY